MRSLYWMTDWSIEAISGMTVAVVLMVGTLLFHSPKKVFKVTFSLGHGLIVRGLDIFVFMLYHFLFRCKRIQEFWLAARK